jgi:hypothetical protein
MPIDAEQLGRFNKDYESVTGKKVQKFVCPIMLRDDPEAELCDGHILNRQIREASRATVVQRKDVDGHFGATIEPDFIRFVNTPVSPAEELFKQARDLTVIGPSGEKIDAFFANKKAKPNHQKIDLLNDKGVAAIATVMGRILGVPKCDCKSKAGSCCAW